MAKSSRKKDLIQTPGVIALGCFATGIPSPGVRKFGPLGEKILQVDMARRDGGWEALEPAIADLQTLWEQTLAKLRRAQGVSLGDVQRFDKRLQGWLSGILATKMAGNEQAGPATMASLYVDPKKLIRVMREAQQKADRVSSKEHSQRQSLLTEAWHLEQQLAADLARRRSPKNGRRDMGGKIKSKARTEVVRNFIEQEHFSGTLAELKEALKKKRVLVSVSTLSRTLPQNVKAQMRRMGNPARTHRRRGGREAVAPLESYTMPDDPD